jgi:hypothetical protein
MVIVTKQLALTYCNDLLAFMDFGSQKRIKFCWMLHSYSNRDYCISANEIKLMLGHEPIQSFPRMKSYNSYHTMKLIFSKKMFNIKACKQFYKDREEALLLKKIVWKATFKE